MKRIIAIKIILLLISCQGKVPVTFKGESFSEYVNEEKREIHKGIYGKWKVVSINHDIAPNNINLNDLDLLLDFKEDKDSIGNLFSGKNIEYEIWGHFNTDEQGNIKFAEIESTNVNIINKGVRTEYRPIAEGFMRGLRFANKYKFEDSELVIVSDQEVLILRPY